MRQDGNRQVELRWRQVSIGELRWPADVTAAADGHAQTRRAAALCSASRRTPCCFWGVKQTTGPRLFLGRKRREARCDNPNAGEQTDCNAQAVVCLPRRTSTDPLLTVRARDSRRGSGGQDARLGSPHASRLKGARDIYLSRYSAGRGLSLSVRARAAPRTCRRDRARSGSSSTLSYLAARCHAPDEGKARVAVGGWRLACGGWRLAVGGWGVACGGWRVAGVRQEATGHRLEA